MAQVQWINQKNGSGAEEKSKNGSGAEASLDGHWTKGTIEGDVLTWREGGAGGNKPKFTRTSPKECKLITKKGTYKGKLEADGKIWWSDGDVWSRCESQEPEKIGVSVESLHKNPHRRRLEREALERA